MSPDLRAADVLGRVRAHRAERDAAERALLKDAITWAGLHEATEDPVKPPRAAS